MKKMPVKNILVCELTVGCRLILISIIILAGFSVFSYGETLPLDTVNNTQIEWLEKKYSTLRICNGAIMTGFGIGVYAIYNALINDLYGVNTPLPAYYAIMLGAPGMWMIGKEILNKNKDIGSIRMDKSGRMYIYKDSLLTFDEILSGILGCTTGALLIALPLSYEEWNTENTVLSITGGAISVVAGLITIIDGITNRKIPIDGKAEEHIDESKSVRFNIVAVPGYTGILLSKRY